MLSRLNSDCDESENRRFWIRDKVRQLERKMKEIKTAKEQFMEKFSNTEKDIEIVKQRIVWSVQAREYILKNQLQNIAREKISEWNRQLEVCQDAEQNLGMFNNIDVEALDAVRAICRPLAESIGFINTPELKFEFDKLVLTKIENFGRVSPIFQPKLATGGGQQNKECLHPKGVCSDATGRILVADCINNQIQVFNEFGEFLFHFGKLGSRPGELHHPTGIASDKKLRIIVADKQNHRIQVFTYKGGFIIAFGQKGTQAGQFSSPLAVAVNECCDIAVSDTENRRIQLFTRHGDFLRQFCFPPNRKVSPMGIAFKPNRSLMVSDFQNNRLLTIDADFTEARVMEGMDLDFCGPVGVACNREGVFAVADRNTIKVFYEDGNLRRSINGFGDTEEDCPRDVCFVSDGRIAVVEKNTLRVY